MIHKKHVFLIGPMGAGKTTIGKHLAKHMEVPFFDIDNEVIKATGADISWIFDVEGEIGFRSRESKALKSVSKIDPPAIISTGGGIILTKDNRRFMKDNGFIVYLYVNENQLYERLKKDKKRPLLQVGDRKKLIANLFHERDPLYKSIADIIYTPRSLQLKKVIPELFHRISKRV